MSHTATRWAQRAGGGALALVLTAILAAVAWAVLSPGSVEERPGLFDALKKELYRETTLEVEVRAQGPADAPESIRVIFTFVPPGADKRQLEATTRAKVKKHFPSARVIDVAFGDNLRARPVEAPEQ